MSDDPQFHFSIQPLPQGEAVTFEEVEQRLLKQLEERGGECRGTLWDLVSIYSRVGKIETATGYLERIVELAGDDVEEVAACHLSLGCQMEKKGDYHAAVAYYRAAFGMEPTKTGTWYYIHNNLGFSLNQLGHFEEAEPILRTAIEINPQRPNGHKNLGLCLVGLDHHREAAKCFVEATRAQAADGRSLRHLEELVQDHPELLEDVPGLEQELTNCRGAVKLARSQQHDLEAYWHQCRKEQEEEGGE